ncbi:MAG: hypothetical protein ACR2ND_00815 [Solirubrobacteraceae bacterium]
MLSRNPTVRTIPLAPNPVPHPTPYNAAGQRLRRPLIEQRPVGWDEDGRPTEWQAIYGEPFADNHRTESRVASRDATGKPTAWETRRVYDPPKSARPVKRARPVMRSARLRGRREHRAAATRGSPDSDDGPGSSPGGDDPPQIYSEVYVRGFAGWVLYQLDTRDSAFLGVPLGPLGLRHPVFAAIGAALELVERERPIMVGTLDEPGLRTFTVTPVGLDREVIA